MGWKMVYNFLGKDKNREKSLLTSLKTSLWERGLTFFHTVYPSKNHVTTHPDFFCVIITLSNLKLTFFSNVHNIYLIGID